MGYILSFKIDINMSQIQANKITKENTHTHTHEVIHKYIKSEVVQTSLNR